jgi:hypothetical protein
MGVLDDAIREHLELKRRHGASDEEIAQEEAEALGPARRDFPAQAATEEPEADTAVEDTIPAAVEPTSAETVTDEPPPAAPEPEPEPEPEGTLEPEPDTRHPTPDTRHPAPDTRHPDDPPPQRDDEDVLEETPDFLQDAPEHDRLWFEQKPPRDFDFE